MKPSRRLLLAVFRFGPENPWATAVVAAIRHLVPPPRHWDRKTLASSVGPIRHGSGEFSMVPVSNNDLSKRLKAWTISADVIAATSMLIFG